MAGEPPNPVLGVAAGRAVTAVLLLSLAGAVAAPSLAGRALALYAAAEAAYFLLFRHRCVWRLPGFLCRGRRGEAGRGARGGPCA
jgi:hypothetical protein